MGFFPPPSRFPPKGIPKRPRPPRRGLFSLVKVGYWAARVCALIALALAALAQREVAHRGMRDHAGMNIEAVGKMPIFDIRALQALVRKCERAKVEVRATAPGMLVTQ